MGSIECGVISARIIHAADNDGDGDATSAAGALPIKKIQVSWRHHPFPVAVSSESKVGGGNRKQPDPRDEKPEPKGETQGKWKQNETAESHETDAVDAGRFETFLPHSPISFMTIINVQLFHC